MSLSDLNHCLTGENVMKAYLLTTGVVFALLTLAHLLRIIVEWPHLAKDPLFLLITVAAGGFCVWAWRLLRFSTRSWYVRGRNGVKPPALFSATEITELKLFFHF